MPFKKKLLKAQAALFMRRCAVLGTFLILFAVFFCSCHPGIQDSKNVFHLNIATGYLESLDPAFAKDINMMWIDHMLYNTLVETDEQLHTVPSLARSWEVSPDGLVYTFHLRSDVFFQDNALFPGGVGRRFSASDIVYSFSRITSPATASPGAWIFNDRVAATDPFIAVNDSTFQITLRTPFRPLPQMLAMPYCNIIAREVADHYGKDYRSHPCGTGPFIFKYWDEGNALILLRNPHYWEKDQSGRRLPYLEAVQVSFIDSKASEFLLFMQGKVDFVNGVDGASKDLILSKEGTLKNDFSGKFRMRTGAYLNTEYIGFLTDTTNAILNNQPTANPLIRRAINYAIDRRKIVTYFKNSMCIPATHGFIPAGMPGYDSAAQYGYNYDPAKALRLLAQAGHPGGRGLKPIKVLVPNNYEDIVNFIASELREVGVTLSLELMQPNVLKQQMARSQAIMFRAQWLADYPDAETYLVCFNSHFPAPPNYSRFRNPAFDSCYTQSLTLPDTERWQLYRYMDSLAISDAPIIPLYYEKLVHLTQNNITGFTSNPMNLIDLKRVEKK